MSDSVNHPSHYTDFSNGAEVIDITENLSFNLGNVVKYVSRAGRKDPNKLMEDLHKARFYLEREIQRLDGDEPESVWSLASVTEQFERLWGYRGAKTTVRRWPLLDLVPPGVVVEDQDGDRYRRIRGTSKFEVSFLEDYGQFYEWQPLPAVWYLVQGDYAPFTEVISE